MSIEDHQDLSSRARAHIRRIKKNRHAQHMRDRPRPEVLHIRTLLNDLGEYPIKEQFVIQCHTVDFALPYRNLLLVLDKPSQDAPGRTEDIWARLGFNVLRLMSTLTQDKDTLLSLLDPFPSGQLLQFNKAMESSGRISNYTQVMKQRAGEDYNRVHKEK